MGVSCMGCVNTSADPRFVSLRVNVTFSLSFGIGEITDVKTKDIDHASVGRNGIGIPLCPSHGPWP